MLLIASETSNTDEAAAASKRTVSESSGENEVRNNKKLKLTEANEGESADTTNTDAVAETAVASETAAVTTTPATASITTKPSEKKNDIGKEAAIEAEVRAARERALVPLETRVKQFKDMLKEKDVRN